MCTQTLVGSLRAVMLLLRHTRDWDILHSCTVRTVKTLMRAVNVAVRPVSAADYSQLSLPC